MNEYDASAPTTTRPGRSARHRTTSTTTATTPGPSTPPPTTPRGGAGSVPRRNRRASSGEVASSRRRSPVRWSSAGSPGSAGRRPTTWSTGPGRPGPRRTAPPPRWSTARTPQRRRARSRRSRTRCCPRWSRSPSADRRDRAPAPGWSSARTARSSPTTTSSRPPGNSGTVSVGFDDGYHRPGRGGRHRPADRPRRDPGQGRLGPPAGHPGRVRQPRRRRAGRRHRIPVRPRRHGHQRHRVRAQPAGVGHRREQRDPHDVPRDPDRRRDQPRQLRWPAGQHERRGGRHQLLDPHLLQLPGRPGRLDRPRLRDPARRGAAGRGPAAQRRGARRTPSSGSRSPTPRATTACSAVPASPRSPPAPPATRRGCSAATSWSRSTTTRSPTPPRWSPPSAATGPGTRSR